MLWPGYGYERQRQGKDDFKVFILSSQNGIVIYWSEEGYIKGTCLKRKKHFGFRHVTFEMPSEHPRAEDPAAYVKNLKFRRKFWARCIKSGIVSL